MAKKTGTAQADLLDGTAKADELFGLGGKDILNGLAGNDYLDGGAGDDDLRGGLGNDIYIVDNQGDINKTRKDPGIDIVGALITYTLGAQQENLTILGTAALSATGNSLGNQLTGNDAANILKGLGGNDILDGHKGIDDLRGGAGNDLYVIDNARDINKTFTDSGRDEVHSSVSYELGVFQENLVLIGKAAISATGSSLANILVGNDAANTLRGMDGIDDLRGGKGNDRLFGGAGADQLRGGDGADTLNGDAGNDVLLGGAGADVLNGGADNDFLNGEAGVDVLRGGSGDDIYRLDGTLVKGVANDTAAEIGTGSDPGTDTVEVNFDYTLGVNQENITLYGSAHRGVGNDGDNKLDGSNSLSLNGVELLGLDGNDTLTGGLFADHLVGGDGNDTYEINNANDIDALDVDAGTDTVKSSISYTLLPNQENLTLVTSTTLLNGDGNGDRNLIRGNSTANILHGHGGNDELIGGGGADSLFGDAGDDTIHYQSSATLIDGGADTDTLFLLEVGVANVTLDLTAIDNAVIKDIEAISFAPESVAIHQTHVLTMNASDVLALSSTTDFLQVFGESDDTVNLTGGGWTKDAGLFLDTFQGYTNGSAHVLMGLDADKHELVTVNLT